MGKVTALLSVFIVSLFLPDIIMGSNETRELTEATNKFALDLYQALRNSSKNVVVSPISLQIVLAMAHQGAKGITASEIAKVLHLPEDNAKVLEGQKALISGLQNPLLKLATRMFVEKTLHLLPTFQDVTTKYFLSDVKGVDFVTSPNVAREEINTWAEENTNHKIKDLLPEDAIDSLTRLVLVNAVHFKANWNKKFDENRTQDMPFYITPENTVNVKMMVMTNTKYRYKESEKLDAKILEIPYAGNEFSMIIILPNKIDGLSAVEDKLASLNLSEELSELSETTVNLYLPRFKLEETMDLGEILKKMGMPTAFSGSADFSGISNASLAVSKVVQKAFIEVNEEGTEAAAATAAVMTRSMKPKILCDRPFVFFIMKGDLALFQGNVNNPV